MKDLDGGDAGPIAVVSRNTSSLPDGLGETDSFGAAITRDGGYVAFDSLAQNLVTGDTNAVTDVFRGFNGMFSR